MNHVRPVLSADHLRRMVEELIGFVPEAACPDECYSEEELQAGYLAALLAGAQWQIQARPRLADVVEQAYHGARCQLGFGNCACHPSSET